MTHYNYKDSDDTVLQRCCGLCHTLQKNECKVAPECSGWPTKDDYLVLAEEKRQKDEALCPQTKPEYIKACTAHGLMCIDGRGGADCTYIVAPEPGKEEQEEEESRQNVIIVHPRNKYYYEYLWGFIVTLIVVLVMLIVLILICCKYQK